MDNGIKGEKNVPISTVVIESVTEKDSRDASTTTKPTPDVIINYSKMQALTRLDAKAQDEISKRFFSNATEPKKHKGWDHFWKGTIDDVKNKSLISIKILFFFKAATLFVLYPFLTLHIKSLGLDAAEAGINSAFIPIVAILSSPISGIIADKIGNFKVLLASLTFVNAGVSLLLLLVPVARETIILPDNLTFSIGCSNEISNKSSVGSFNLEMVGENTCTVDLSSAPWENLLSSVVQCGSLCPVTPSKVDKHYPTLTTLPLSFNKTYVLAGKRATFVPFSNQRPDLVCSGQENNTCFLAFENASILEMTVETNIFQLSSPFLNSEAGSKFVENVTTLSYPMKGSWKFAKHDFKQVPACMGITSKSHGMKKCTTQCLVTFKRNLFCSNTKEDIIYDVSLTFWMYTIFRVMLGLGSAMTWIMFEGAVLAILKETGGDYGLQRVSASVASIFVSPMSGALIYYFQDFRPAFCLYAILQFITALLTLRIDLTFKKPAEKILSHLKDVLSQAEIIIFFVAMLISGSVWGYLESFLFWFLKNLGGNEILMGLTLTVGGLVGLPFLISSRVIIKRIGHVNVLCLGLLFYFIRLIGYSAIENPWFSLPFEALEAITASLAITAAATYASALSTEETIASVQGMMGALYFGFGRGMGSLIGGFLIQWYGERVTFQLFGVAALVACILYFMMNAVYIRKLKDNRVRGRLNDERDVRKLSNRINPQITIDEIGEDLNKELDGVEGGHIGPCDVNTFTDVPLDEEPESIDSPPKKLTRPASFPDRTKIKVDITHSRSNET